MDVKRGTWPTRLRSLEFETVKYDHESGAIRTREWLLWRGPAAIVNYRHILSSKRMLHKNYNRSVQLKKY
jgi:hypothetical protein